jgi:uncharacterized protein
MLKNKEVLMRSTLLALAVSNGIYGRKKLQKIVYLANCAGWNVIQDYRFHLYGPYSDYVLSEIENLSEERLIKEGEKTTQADNIVYFYKLTEEGHQLLQMLKEEIRSPELINRTDELINELNKFTSDELEIMASLYYLHRQSPSSTHEELIYQLSDLKPHVSSQQTQDALRIFDIMDGYQRS